MASSSSIASRPSNKRNREEEERVIPSSSSIASRWRELSGKNNWAGMLDPVVDDDLRRYIIHYGQSVAAVGDLFNDETLNCKCEKEEFFPNACLVKGNKFKYKVTHFFYAGSTSVKPAWFGYVAVTTKAGMAALGRLDILIAWRGTATISEWINDINVKKKSASELFGTSTNAKVHSGFLSLYTGTRPDSPYSSTSAREQVRNAIRELLKEYQTQVEEISITVAGFSLGAALATLNAMDIVFNGYNKPEGNPNKSFMVAAFVYGGPAVGDTGLKEVFERLSHHDLRLLRITNRNDPVPKILKGFYTDFETSRLKIDTSQSNYLKWRIIGRDFVLPDDSTAQEAITATTYFADRGLSYFFSAHNMDVYLHGVAGVQNDGFRLVVDHDIALVNKHLDRLKKKYKIPTHWWEGKNRKKMVQDKDGRWKVIAG